MSWQLSNSGYTTVYMAILLLRRNSSIYMYVIQLLGAAVPVVLRVHALNLSKLSGQPEAVIVVFFNFSTSLSVIA